MFKTDIGYKSRLHWHPLSLMAFLDFCLRRVRFQKRLIGDASPFWIFIHAWPKQKAKLIADFIAGTYRFEPLMTYSKPGENEKTVVWTYTDRLFVRTLLHLIKPFFKHIISPNCFHLNGSAGVKNAVNLVKKALNINQFRYFLRVDIKSYYASINHQILINQTKTHFKDPRILKYLEDIITIPIIENAAVYTPKQGIPIRSSLSPFFSALYLSPLDQAFLNSKDICYVRFVDDILILVKTKKQFCQAKKRLYKILSNLKLKCSKRKTKMGQLTKGFHFLGVNFTLNQINEESSNHISDRPDPLINNAETRTRHSQFQVDISLHERSCVRAMNKIFAMKEDCVHPHYVQRYLFKWSIWWTRTTSLIPWSECLKRWLQRASNRQPELAWLATGLLALRY